MFDIFHGLPGIRLGYSALLSVRPLMKSYALLVPALFLCCTIASQESAESRGPDRGTDFRVHGIQVLPATGRPFSGIDRIEWTRDLDDGNVVVTQLDAAVARDSQGRIYREHRSFVPVNSNQQSKQLDIVLFDPVNHTTTTCIIATRSCTMRSYHAAASFVPPPIGSFSNGKRYLTRENLGSSVIDDLNVNGTRESVYISAGAAGNSRTLVRTKEFWYSPELQINLKVTRNDPREGVQVLQLVNLSRAEPNSAIFQPPAGFTVHDLRRQNRP